MIIETELLLIKKGMRKAGMSTRGVLTKEYQNMTVEEEKKWRNIRKKARSRVKELQERFPVAFGLYERERNYRLQQREFLRRAVA